VENPAATSVSAHLLLELVDPIGTVQSREEKDAQLHPGVNRLDMSLPVSLPGAGGVGVRELLWHRVRYIISTAASEGNANQSHPPAPGILSIGAATAEVFELHVAAPVAVRGGGRYFTRVRAIHPVTGRPVAGVAVQASLDSDSDDSKPFLTRPAITNPMG